MRTELAGAKREAVSLKAAVDQLTEEIAKITRRLGAEQDEARREATADRVAREAAEAKLQAAIAERDLALGRAEENYRAWANARSKMAQLQREVANAKNSASAGWLVALLGTVGGAIAGAAAAEPPPVVVPRRRKPKRRG